MLRYKNSVLINRNHKFYSNEMYAFNYIRYDYTSVYLFLEMKSYLYRIDVIQVSIFTKSDFIIFDENNNKLVICKIIVCL